jgi:hypothetical protein
LVFVHADAENSAAERRDAALQLIQGLRFVNAGRAPGGPEIQKDDFAAKVRKVRGLAIEGKGEVLGRSSTQAGFALAIIGPSE